MKKFENIEELFRKGLEGFEADPGAGSWGAIQSKIAAQQAAVTSAATATSVLSSAKVALIVGLISVTAGLGIGYALWNGKEEAKTTPAVESTKETVSVENKVAENENPEYASNAGNNSSAIIVETPSENKSGAIERKVIVVKDPSERYSSYVNSWLTPSNKKDQLLSGKTNPVIEKQNPETPGGITSAIKEENLQVTQVAIDESKPNAVISASVSGGPAPLHVSFTNAGNGAGYEWNFGDGETSTEQNPEHLFRETGVYTVTLTVKDNKGQRATDKIIISVLESSEITYTNVFSPNGDNVNDYFMLTSKNIQALFVEVFDLSGHILFSSNDVHFNWDGLDRDGKKLPAGTYYYRCKAIGNDGKQHSHVGNLTISY